MAAAPHERQRDADRTRAEILVAATQEFAEHRYSGARVDVIATKTRTTKRMLYYYFESKAGLYTAVLEREYAGIRESEQELDVEELDPVAAIRRVAEHLRVANRHTFGALFGRDLMAPERRERYRAMLGDMVVDFLRAGKG